MFAYINISGGNLIKSYKFDQQYLNMLLNNVQCTLCILICVLITCIFIFSSKSEITPTITPLRGFFLNLSWFAFHAQDEKNQIITTNVWLNLVSHIIDFESKMIIFHSSKWGGYLHLMDTSQGSFFGRKYICSNFDDWLEEFYLTFCVENWFVTRSGPTPTWSGILPSTAMWRI